MKISIRGARADRGMTQAAVAERLGVSVPTYSVLERDPKRITWEQAETLAQLFNRRIEDLAFYTPWDSATNAKEVSTSDDSD